ncbi:MAG: hypothetical protein L6Q57_09725 [Alphaproteobacteria bacterium]|nr:hypothetical protein [Alphaproteobacteria bacterium]
MLCIPERLTEMSHPLIRDIYRKQDYRDARRQMVLVIQTNSKRSQWMDLLTDLNDLSKTASKKLGPFERIDIVCAE